MPQPLQLLGSLFSLVSQPLAAIESQSPKGGWHLETPQPVGVHIAVPLG